MSTSTTAVQRIVPAGNISGSVALPGDKSISHRYAMLAGLAEGITRLHNFSTGADPHSTLACMRALGADVTVAGGEISITGTAGAFHEPSAPLDCGNSGSTMRMLSGLVLAHPHRFTLTGDASLSHRPMERIRTPLSRFLRPGSPANIVLTAGHAPIMIHGGAIDGIEFETPIASAQVKTAVLFAGVQASGVTRVNETIRTRDHTEHALRAFGVRLTREGNRVGVRGGQKLYAMEATIPGDLSSAAFFLAAALLFPDSQIVLDAVGLNPTRAALLDVVRALGARIRILAMEEHFGEMVGTLQINGDGTPLAPAAQPFEIAGPLTAQLIDEIPVLAAVAPYTRSGLRIRDARELRVKESDRIDLVCRNLRAMGAHVLEHEDGMDIPGGQILHGAEVDSGSDHRIAMAFAVAALRASSPTEISGAEAAAISFPEFFTYLENLAQR